VNPQAMRSSAFVMGALMLSACAGADPTATTQPSSIAPTAPTPPPGMPSCNWSGGSGGRGVTRNRHYLGDKPGLVSINYNLYVKPDEIKVFCRGEVIGGTDGFRSGGE
jgi:hypothetical protein